MPITLGDTTITGLIAGGILDADVIVSNTLVANSIPSSKLLYGTTRSIVANGYIRLPTGLIIQWGGGHTVSTATIAWYSATISFPIAFPTACVCVYQTSTTAPAEVASNFVAVPSTGSWTTSSFTSRLRKLQTGGTFTSSYIAIGY